MRTSLHRLLELETGETPANEQERHDLQLYLERLDAEPGQLPTDWLRAEPLAAGPPAGGPPRAGWRGRLLAAWRVAVTLVKLWFVWAVAAFGFAAEAARQVRQRESDQQRATERAAADRAEVERQAAAARRERLLKEEIERQRDAEAAAVRDLVAQAEVMGPYQATGPGARPLLDKVRGHLSALAAGAEREPARAGEAADLYRRAGRLAFNLSDLPRAEADYAAARRLAELALADDDRPATRHRLAMALREWGVIRANQGQGADARAAWDRALELLGPVAGNEPEYQFTAAQLRMVRANGLALAGSLREAADEYGAAERLVEGLLGGNPGNRHYRFTLAEILNNRAFLVGRDAAEWEADCRRAVAIQRELAAEEPNRPEQRAYLAASLNHLGNTLRVQTADKLFEAEKLYKEAFDIYGALVLVFPGVPSNRVEQFQVRLNLERVAARQARIAPSPRPRGAP